MPQYDDWYAKNIFNEWFAFALSDRFDREDFFTCFPSKWQYWRDAYTVGFVTKIIIECLECCTYHFRQVDNWYVAERTSTFEGE